MRQLTTTFVGVGVIVIGGAVMSAAWVMTDDETEEPITLDQLPEAVRDTILREAGDGQILALVREVEDGEVAYEAEISGGGGAFEVEVAPDGTVLEREAAGDDGEDDDDDAGEDDD
ncbi:MAG: hypothetical protein ACYSTY_08650 [Planctomycetota bacterium]|jgi:hypothetical protein